MGAIARFRKTIKLRSSNGKQQNNKSAEGSYYDGKFV